MVEQPMPIEGASGALAASTRLLTLSQGVYRFSVAPGSPIGIGKAEHLSLPAVYIAVAPTTPAKAASLVAGPSTKGTWLSEAGHLVFARVTDDTAKLLMTSIPAADGEELTIEIDRVDETAAAPAATPRRKRAAPPIEPVIEPAIPLAAQAAAPLTRKPLRLQIIAHMRNRGDVTFIDVPWAGRVGAGLWMEAFEIRPLEGLAPADIEYRGLTGSGFETAWVAGGESCGTRGKADPLVAFAARLKPGRAEPRYDFEYSGYFRSGALVGPIRNGAPCRSTVKDDPLEGIQLRIVDRNPADSETRAVRASGGAAAEPLGGDIASAALLPAAPAKRLRFTKAPLAKIVARKDRATGGAAPLAPKPHAAATRKASAPARRAKAARPSGAKRPGAASAAAAAKKRRPRTARAAKPAAPGKGKTIAAKPARRAGQRKFAKAASAGKASKTRPAAKSSRRPARARRPRGR